MAHGITLTLKAITPYTEHTSSMLYAKFQCHNWYNATHDERILAKHYDAPYARPSRTYRGKRRNNKRSMAWPLRKALGMRPHESIPHSDLYLD